MQRRKPYKAKGAVLIMVLTVMFVLIFLLAGAVAVVYSSNRRVMVQYEESQAYYTARSVLDVYHDMILASDDTSKVTGNYYELDKTTYEVTASTTYPNISSGRALELDLYRVPVSVNATIGEANFNKTFADDYNAAADDAARSAVVRSRNMTEDVAATDTGNNIGKYLEQYTVTGSKSSKYSVGDADANQIASVTDWSGATPKYAVGKDDTLVYYVNYDKAKSESNFSKYQGTPTGSNSAANKLTDPGSTVKLTVQVIDRVYDLSTDAAFTTFGDKFIHGNRQKDYFLIKVTAEVVYDGQIVTTSAVYENMERAYPSPPASKAIVSMTDIDTVDSVLALGGGSTLKRQAEGLVGASNDFNSEGNLFFQSNFTPNTKQWFVYCDANSGIFTRGDMIINNANPLFTTGFIKTGAYVYAARSIVQKANNANGSYGSESDTECMSYFTKKFSVQSDQSYIAGMGIFETINIDVTPNLDNLSGKGIFRKTNSSDAQNGKYYCNYLVVPESLLSDDHKSFRPNSNGKTLLEMVKDGASISITQGIQYVDSTGATQTVPIDDFNCDGTKFKNEKSLGTINLDYEGTAVDGNYQKTINLPVAPAGKTEKKIVVDTVRSLYKSYFNDTGRTDGKDTWDANGDLNAGALPEDSDYDAKISAFIDDHVKTAEDMLLKNSKDLNNLGISPSTPQVWNNQVKLDTGANLSDSPFGSYQYYINSDTVIPSGTNTNIYLIDTTGGPVTLSFGTSASNNQTGAWSYTDYGGVYCVYGHNDLNIVIPSNTAGAKVRVGNNAGQYRFQVYDYDLGASPSDLYISGHPTPTETPNINWYVSSNIAEFNVAQGTYTCQGYVNAPKTEFVMNNCTAAIEPNVYTGAWPTTNVRAASEKGVFLGSVLSKKFSSGSAKYGVIYISEDNKGGGPTPGKPLYSWPAQYYTMN